MQVAYNSEKVHVSSKPTWVPNKQAATNAMRGHYGGKHMPSGYVAWDEDGALALYQSLKSKAALSLGSGHRWVELLPREDGGISLAQQYCDAGGCGGADTEDNATKSCPPTCTCRFELPKAEEDCITDYIAVSTDLNLEVKLPAGPQSGGRSTGSVRCILVRDITRGAATSSMGCSSRGTWKHRNGDRTSRVKGINQSSCPGYVYKAILDAYKAQQLRPFASVCNFIALVLDWT